MHDPLGVRPIIDALKQEGTQVLHAKVLRETSSTHSCGLHSNQVGNPTLAGGISATFLGGSLRGVSLRGASENRENSLQRA